MMTPFGESTKRRWAAIAFIAFGFPTLLAVSFPGTLADLYYHLRYPGVLTTVENFSRAIAQADFAGAASSESEEPGGLSDRIGILETDRREALQHIFQTIVHEGVTIRGIQTLSSDHCLAVIHYPAKPGPEGSSHIDFILGRTDHWRIRSVLFVRIPDWPGGLL